VARVFLPMGNKAGIFSSRGAFTKAYTRSSRIVGPVNNFSDAETFVINYSRVISELCMEGRRRSEMIRIGLV